MPELVLHFYIDITEFNSLDGDFPSVKRRERRRNTPPHIYMNELLLLHKGKCRAKSHILCSSVILLEGKLL